MKTLQMNQKADYGNWVPAAMMKTLWTATAAIAHRMRTVEAADKIVVLFLRRLFFFRDSSTGTKRVANRYSESLQNKMLSR